MFCVLIILQSLNTLNLTECWWLLVVDLAPGGRGGGAGGDSRVSGDVIDRLWLAGPGPAG